VLPVAKIAATHLKKNGFQPKVEIRSAFTALKTCTV